MKRISFRGSFIVFENLIVFRIILMIRIVTIIRMIVLIHTLMLYSEISVLVEDDIKRSSFSLVATISARTQINATTLHSLDGILYYLCL